MTRNLSVLFWLLAVFSLSIAVENEEELGHCDDLSCASREKLLDVIRQLQEEKMSRRDRGAHSNAFIEHSSVMKNPFRATVLEAATNATCDICTSNPCQNGGTCIADQKHPFTKYMCICPDDYSGPNCEIHHVCTNTTCGLNADCYVRNHQTNCVCKPGYLGNPRVNCRVQTIKACSDGDPHFKSFDGLYYDYQGTCPFIYSEPCTSLAPPFSYYSVKAKSELAYVGAQVSYIREVEVEFYTIRIHVDGTKRQVYVNGYKTCVPYYWPSKSNPRVSVKYSSGTFFIQNDQNVLVTYDYTGRLCLQVPNVPEFQGNDTLCGVAGNINNNKADDVRFKNGTVLHLDNPNARQPTKDNGVIFNKAEDSWITDDFLKLKDYTCVNGEQLYNNSDCKDPTAAAARCKPLSDAMIGQGVFAKCKDMGNETITQLYDDCVYDICHVPKDQCTPIETFVHECMWYLPDTDLGDWRTPLNCLPNCPPNSHYSSCKTSCPPTCANATLDPFCDYGCSEGCACDDGYVLDNNNLVDFTCVPVDKCGCVDGNGNSHPANETWLSNNCTVWNICSNGTWYSKPNYCSPNAYCGIDTISWMPICVCNPGYEGDGYNCESIDYCKNNQTCGQDKNHGTCTDTPGNYTCQCNGFWTGRDCELYGPRRHCADLFVYHGYKTDGVYTITPPFPFGGNAAGTNVSVYCTMTQNGGGWTLMSRDTGALMANKTMIDYVNGFGTWDTQIGWLGLDLIHGMTNLHDHSLRLDLLHCASNNVPESSTDCTYKYFTVQDSNTGYSVVIPQVCTGTEIEYYDGWARWNLTGPGPQFIAYNNDNGGCSAHFRNTGWWFDTTNRCGSANLNGIRYTCNNQPPVKDQQTYLFWGGSPLGQASLSLRPTEFPNYDHIPPSA